jgi:hypothetical protein
VRERERERERGERREREEREEREREGIYIGAGRRPTNIYCPLPASVSVCVYI